jgi:UDP-glucose 4-epimerase
MRVLITGGGGFIGSHIAEFHLAKGDEVFVVDDFSTGSINNINNFISNPSFEYEKANIVSWKNADEKIAWADRIYHFAAVLGIFRVMSEPLTLLNTNIIGTERLLDAISKSKHNPRVILASSSSVYGNSPQPLLKEDNNLIIASPSHPLWGYAISKIADEALSIAYYTTEKMRISLIRLFNTIGPRQTGRYGMVVPRFVKQAINNEPLTVFGDGKQTRSFCDVRDSVKMLDLIAEKSEAEGQIYNVGRDVDITINELAELVRKRANSSSEIKYIPYLEAYGKEFTDIKQRKPDLTKLYNLTHFKHAWTLEKTIDNLIELNVKVTG